MGWPKILLGVAVAGGLIWLYADTLAEGARSEAVKIERKNNDAGNNADDGRARFDDCPGGLWDFGAGKCAGPAPRGRD